MTRHHINHSDSVHGTAARGHCHARNSVHSVHRSVHGKEGWTLPLFRTNTAFHPPTVSTVSTFPKSSQHSRKELVTAKNGRKNKSENQFSENVDTVNTVPLLNPCQLNENPPETVNTRKALS